MDSTTTTRAGPSSAPPLKVVASRKDGRTGKVRPLVEGDIPEVVELHRRVFRSHQRTSEQTESACGEHLKEIFLRYPWRDESMTSLVYSEDDGRIIGCLGVMPRPMLWNGSPVRVAISHHLMVDPSSRSTLAGVKLLKSFVAGPQELSLATEANHTSHKVWEGLGGKTSLLYSIRWTRALRPSRFVLSRLETRRSLAPFALALRPLGWVVDAALARAAGSHFEQSAPRVYGDDAGGEGLLLEWLREVARHRALQPVYDDGSLRWLLEQLGRMTEHGALRKIMVRNSMGEIIGYYIHFLNPGGVSAVVQVAAKDGAIEDVLDHLFYDAWRLGMIAVSGQLDPRYMAAFLAKQCFFHGGSWMLAHSRNPELLHALDRGDAFLTRLEGEWPLGL